jgi:hypothetical protein
MFAVLCAAAATTRRKLKAKENNPKKGIRTVSYAELLALTIRNQFLGILELPFKQ